MHWTDIERTKLTDICISFLTPLNLILATLVFLLFALRIRAYVLAGSNTIVPSIPEPILYRTFTPQTLLPYNGENGKEIYFGVRGKSEIPSLLHCTENSLSSA